MSKLFYKNKLVTLYCGAGVAAIKTGRQAILIEREEKYCEI